MQGPSRRLGLRIRVTAAFALAFLVAAVLVFALLSLLGTASGAAGLPLAWRRGVAAAGVLVLAAVDGWSIRRRRYCPLAWRRQTPRRLMFNHSATRTAAAWGFDTGLAVTTFRVAALTWGAALFTLFGLAGWWIGAAYGLGFVVPLVVVLWTHRAGRAAHAAAPADPGLEKMLAQRPRAQLVSLMLLAGAGVGLLARLLV